MAAVLDVGFIFTGCQAIPQTGSYQQLFDTMSSPGFKVQELHNSHDLAGLKAIATPDCKFVMGDNDTVMDWTDYVDICAASIFASFPDIHFNWTETNELSDGTVTSKLVVSGTHTGIPFGFGMSVVLVND